MSSLYDRLGVQRSANGDEIKKAYRDMARLHHPDKGGDTEKFKGIQEAYEVLSDPGRKQMYDVTGSTSEQQQQQQRSPFPDIFSMFAGMHQQQQAPQKMRKDRGPDSSTDVRIGLDGFYNSTEINMNFKQKRRCGACKSTMETCTNCGGAGIRVVMRQMGPMTIQSQELCGGCQGIGKKNNTPCGTCRNQRYIEQVKTITAHITTGMQSGETFVFKGECSDSPEYDTPGDIVVVVRTTPSRYEWKSDDLHISHTITFAESILGFEVTLNDHPSKKVQILTWNGGPVIHGTVLTMEGKGMPKKAGGGFGDIKLKLNVTQPPLVPWTDEQRKVLESVLK